MHEEKKSNEEIIKNKENDFSTFKNRLENLKNKVIDHIEYDSNKIFNENERLSAIGKLNREIE